MTLTCSRCKAEKDEAEMVPDRRRPGGFSSWCRQCMREAKNEWKERKRELEHPGQKWCRGCVKWKPVEHFYLVRSGYAKRRPYCGPCYDARYSNGRRVRHATVYTAGHIANRLKEKRVTQAQWTRMLEAVDVFGPRKKGRPHADRIIAPMDPDGSTGLCSLTICIADAVDKGAVERKALPDSVKEAKKMRDPETREEAA